jgi:hypothetical protein
MKDLRTFLDRAATRARAGHYDEAIAECNAALQCQAADDEVSVSQAEEKAQGHRQRRRQRQRAERRAKAAPEAEEEHARRVTAEKERLLEELRRTNFGAVKAPRSAKKERPRTRTRDEEDDEQALPWKRWVAVAAVALVVWWDASYFWPDSGLKGVSGKPRFSRPAASVAPAGAVAPGQEAQVDPGQRGPWGRGGLHGSP